MTDFFKRLHPLTICTYFAVLLICISLTDYNYLFFIMFSLLCIMDIVFNGIHFFKKIGYFVFLIIAMSVFNVAFNHSGTHVFLYINDVALTYEALTYGIYSGFFVCSLIIWFSLFNSQADNGKIHYLLASRFKTVGLLFSLSLSFSDRFQYKLSIIRQTLYTEGYKKKNLSYAAMCILLLFTVMLFDSCSTADSMIARGYGLNTYKPYKKYRFISDDFIIMFFCIFLFVGFFINHLFIIPIVLLPLIYILIKEALWTFYLLRI